MRYPKNLLKQIEKHLLDKREKIESILSSLESQDPFVDPDRLIDNAASDTDAKEESSHERIEALENELQTNLTEIKQALDRIKRGTYGKCFSCRKMINTDRLAIKPTAVYCVKCAKKKEK